MKVRRGRNIGVVAVALTLTVTSCTPEAEDFGLHQGGVEMRPDLVQPESDAVTAGSTVAVWFPEETTRGVPWSLERGTGDDWTILFLMTSGSAGDADHWTPADDLEGFAWPDIALMGPGPDYVPIPDAAEPGEYRLCTINSAPNLCTEITVTE